MSIAFLMTRCFNALKPVSYQRSHNIKTLALVERKYLISPNLVTSPGAQAFIHTQGNACSGIVPHKESPKVAF